MNKITLLGWLAGSNSLGFMPPQEEGDKPLICDLHSCFESQSMPPLKKRRLNQYALSTLTKVKCIKGLALSFMVSSACCKVSISEECDRGDLSHLMTLPALHSKVGQNREQEGQTCKSDSLCCFPNCMAVLKKEDS